MPDLYQLYYYLVRELIAAKLRDMRREQGALPSVRELAEELGVSPQTVHKVLQDLVQEGVVHALPRKGYFWGRDGHDETLHSTETIEERFRSHFLADLLKGVYHPWKELPSRKALAQLYGVGERRVGRTLSHLVQRGILEQRGRSLFLAPPPKRAPSASVLGVVRCNPLGELLLETEREIDFVKSVRRECTEQGIGLSMLGYCEEDDGHFLDNFGREIDLSRLPGALLGALVSTWLVANPQPLLHRLSCLRLPLSVWWEHASEDFPRTRFQAGLTGFNLSFGESAGVAVGRHLAALGMLDVAFVSPYHNNDWSRARLRGLRDSLETYGGRVQEFVDVRYSSPWQLRNLEEEGMPGLLRASLSDFLDDPRLLAVPTWVLVNDIAAVSMHGLLRESGKVYPRMIGFDNCSDSERLGIDSFEFNTDGMVRQMLYHLINPKAILFADAPIHEMMGHLILRKSTNQISSTEP